MSSKSAQTNWYGKKILRAVAGLFQSQMPRSDGNLGEKLIAYLKGLMNAHWLGATLLVMCLSLPATAEELRAQTPPMGWNSWNWFARNVTDRDIRQAADLIVSSGMRDAGYLYVNIDDTWEGKRDANGVIQPNDKFPDMKSLADYVHSKGLKLGIYSSPGPWTCAHYEGSYGHEEQDAETYAEWGIDYLKYDLCSFRDVMAKEPDLDSQNKMMREAYEKMHQAILRTGRPIVYSLCQYGNDAVWQWGPKVGANLWRTTGDISPTYDRMMLIATEQEGLARYASPGHWNDPDMLEVGNGAMTHDEDVSHMTMWAMLAAPLLAGNNLSLMSEDVREILTNRDVIAIDQDRLGKEAEVIFREGPVEIWSRPLQGGAAALAIFNMGNDRTKMAGMRLHLKEAGFPDGANARDIWAGRNLGHIHDGDVMTVARHGVVLLKLTP